MVQAYGLDALARNPATQIRQQPHARFIAHPYLYAIQVSFGHFVRQFPARQTAY